MLFKFNGIHNCVKIDYMCQSFLVFVLFIRQKQHGQKVVVKLVRALVTFVVVNNVVITTFGDK